MTSTLSSSLTLAFPRLLMNPDALNLHINFHDTTTAAAAEVLDHIIINKTLHKYLNLAKQQIDDCQEAWDKYKKYTNPYEYINTFIPNTKQSVCTLRPLSRSFFKMIEICLSLHLPPVTTSGSIKTFHLAEGPGGFIEALAHLRNNAQDLYYGMTLLDDKNQNVPGWRKTRNFLQRYSNVIIVKGADGTGNLLSPDNLQFCFDMYGGSMDFLTGDGGFDFSCQYPWQEEVSAQLIYAQIAFAIAMQKTGGCFVVKMFDTFTKISLDLLYLLANVYTTIVFQKPQTSRSANSEKYVICSGFRLAEQDRVQLMATLKQGLYNFDTKKLSKIYPFDLPYYFTNKVEEFNAVLGQQQLESIVSTITMVKYHTSKHDKLELMKKQHVQKCIAWCQLYNLPCIKTIDEQNIFLNGPRWNTAENTSGDINVSADASNENTSPKSNIYIPKFKLRANML